jgi:hypothetical protein
VWLLHAGNAWHPQQRHSSCLDQLACAVCKVFTFKIFMSKNKEMRMRRCLQLGFAFFWLRCCQGWNKEADAGIYCD